MNIRKLISRIKGIIISLRELCIRCICIVIIEGWYGGFWHYRQQQGAGIVKEGLKRRMYFYYQERYGCYIGESAEIETVPVFPHDMHGVFISNMSKIGRNVVIFQHVTIGSNTLKGHPRSGSPTIGNNVYIGAGAKIIGNVTIGDNCRIGANCVVVKDMPANRTAVAASTRFIYSDSVNDNEFVSARDFIIK